MTLELKETTDIDDIKAVLCNPLIYDTINDDESPNVDEYQPSLDDARYIGGYLDGKIIALMVYHYKYGKQVCHVQVLPEYRREYAKSFGEQSLSFKAESPLYAEIPDLYKNVLEFAVLNNFEIINKAKGNFIKNGVTYDTNILIYRGE